MNKIFTLFPCSYLTVIGQRVSCIIFYSFSISPTGLHPHMTIRISSSRYTHTEHTHTHTHIHKYVEKNWLIKIGKKFVKLKIVQVMNRIKKETFG